MSAKVFLDLAQQDCVWTVFSAIVCPRGLISPLVSLYWWNALAYFIYSVTRYSTKTALLTLEHNYPPGNTLKALVDVNLLVNTMKSNETQIGEWVNVMGYIQTPLSSNSVAASEAVNIQAIVLWSTGPLNLQGYEQSLAQKTT